MQDMLLPHELDYLLAQEKPTYTVGSCMTFVVDAADIHPELQYGMDVEIRACMQEFGYTDDILRQPLPTPYTRSVTSGAASCTHTLKLQLWIHLQTGRKQALSPGRWHPYCQDIPCIDGPHQRFAIILLIMD